jgi:regulator of PEP synthase PpsR (kinase-PPPase family)
VISDATGETAVRLVHALEAQFPEQEFEEIRHPRVETVDDLALAVNRARGRPAVVVYTLVKPELREAMRALCRRARVHYCDLLGHPIDAVARVSGQAARMTPGARQPLTSSYFKRIAAIEFAVKYDDGVGGGLQDADIVLVGVSRTSKTPLSMYLGYLGHKTANVPIVKGIEPPKALWRSIRRRSSASRSTRSGSRRSARSARDGSAAARATTPSWSRSTRSSRRPSVCTGDSGVR